MWYLKPGPSNLSNCKISQEKQKSLNLGPRILYFIVRYFWAKILKSYCDIWNQHPRICLNAKFREKIKMPNFVTKTPFLVLSGLENSRNHCHNWNQQSQICQFPKFREKTIMSKLVTKNALFGHFWDSILKKYCHILNLHPQICLIVRFGKEE